MLDFFIVLGQVPGTNYQITFNQILVFLSIMLLLWLALIEAKSLLSFLAQMQIQSLHSKKI